jgi:hypothetical protein
MALDSNPIVELFTRINANDSKLNAVINPYDVYAIYLANKFNAGAFQRSVLTACTSSTQAIAMGYDSILSGETEVVIAGGTDSIVNTLATIAFGKLGVISETKDNVNCKPFDKMRNGTLAAEAAGFCVLASEDFVKKNNLSPKAQLLGYGNTLDAYKITAPNPEGTSMTNAIAQAMEMAGIETEKLDYINAHGTGTKHNDHLELTCIRRALGEGALNIPISSTNSRDGNAIGGLSVGEPHDMMYEMTDIVCSVLPWDKPRYLMGVGTPSNLLENIALGVDMFDCVMPTRNARNGMLFTSEGTMNMKNRKWADDYSPLDPNGTSFVDNTYTKAYVRHLFASNELLAKQIATLHNIRFYLWLMEQAQKQLEEGTFTTWKNQMVKKLDIRL